MIPISDPALIAALAGSHTMVPVVTAMYGSEARGSIEITDGSVTFDEGSQIQGRCSVTIPVPNRTLSGVFNPRLLDVSGWRLFIEYGVVFGSVTKTVPIGTFVCYDIDDQDDGRLTIAGYDTTVLLRDGRFLAPYPIPAGTGYEVALEALATAIQLPADFPVTGYTTPLLLFQEGDDRLAKMQEMSTSLGWQVVADPYGQIGARQDAPTSASESVAEFVHGEGSHLVKLARKRTRQGVYNAAVVTGEPAGSTAPVYGLAADLEPSSPTYFYGPFGQVPVFEKSQYVTSNDQATAAATGLLARKKGFGAALSITSWPHPQLRPGDPVHVYHPTMGVDQVIPLRSVTIPLKAGQSSTLQTREGVIA